MRRRFCSMGEGMPTGVRLALAHEDLEDPTDDEMIDLGDLALDVQAEIVDHRPMAAVLQVEVELVGRVRFRPDHPPVWSSDSRATLDKCAVCSIVGDIAGAPYSA